MSSTSAEAPAKSPGFEHPRPASGHPHCPSRRTPSANARRHKHLDSKPVGTRLATRPRCGPLRPEPEVTVTTILCDLRYAVRSLRRVPVFAIAAVASLTLGIATATTVFGLLDAALFRPPPFDEPDRLALLNITQYTPAEGLYRVRWSWPRFRLLERSARSFEAIASSSNAVLTLTSAGDPVPVPVEIVSSRYHSVMRAPITLGRAFSTAEDESGTATPTAILSDDLWRRRFGGDEHVLGRVIEMNGLALTVVGVAGPGFHGLSGLAEAWIPATMAPLATYSDYLTTNQNFITAVGRLRPGTSLEHARAELAVLGRTIQAEEPSEAETPNDRFGATAMSLNEARVDVVTRRALLLLAGAVATLLLIACANVASLLLGRAAGRRREIAIRLAIGAGRWRLVRQLLVESGVLATVSALLGTVLTVWALLVVRLPPTLARGRNFYGAVGEFATPALDWRVLGFVVLVSALSVLFFGLAPALQATRTDFVPDLRTGSAGSGAGATRSREVVVGLQVALAVVLVVGCGLLLTSYARLRSQQLGFEPDRMLTFIIRPSEVRYPPPAAVALIDRVLEEIGRLPGVEAATVDGCAPLATQCANAALNLVGRPWDHETDAPSVLRHYVAPGHFAALGTPILRGRGIEAGDRAGRLHVVVINQTAATRFWPNEDPIGRKVWFTGAAPFASADSAAEIVGVVGDVAYQPLDEHPVQPDFFTSYAQFTYATRMILVRTRGEPLAQVPDIALAVQRAEPGLALFDVQTMAERASRSWSKQTGETLLFATIAGIALALAMTGVYAVTAYAVASRTREIGVRMALGAPAARIVRTSLAQTVRVGVMGGLVGLLGALGLSRVIRATLYDTSPLAGGAYAGAVLVLLLALMAASYLPVRRALRVNPIEVLRTE